MNKDFFTVQTNMTMFQIAYRVLSSGKSDWWLWD